MRVLVVCVFLMAPLAAADVSIVDEAGDLTIEDFQGNPQPVPEQGAFPAADIIGAGLGEETATHVVGYIDFVAAPSATDLGVGKYLRFSFGGIQYQVAFIPCGASEGQLAARQGEGDAFRPLACIAIDDQGARVEATIPKALVKDLDNLPLRKGKQITDWYATSKQPIAISPIGNVQQYATDRGPDIHFGDPLRMAVGPDAQGLLQLVTPQPFRASNGGPDNIVYPVTFEAEKELGEVLLEVSGLPALWEVRAPTRIAVGSQPVTVPVILTTAAAHAHGSSERFTVLATTLDGQHAASLELGVDYLKIPQLTGHHPRLYVHAGATDDDMTQDAWFNTLANDELDSGAPIWTARVTQQNDRYAREWIIPLDPALLIGMDFDVERAGHFETTVSTDEFPLNGALMRAQLWYCHPLDSSGPGGSCGAGSYFLLAEGTSERQNVPSLGSADFEAPLAIDERADLVPYVDGSNIELRVYVSTDDLTIVTSNTVLEPGNSEMELPLNEYQDPVDAEFASIGILGMELLSPTQVKFNAGQKAYFEFTLHNGGANQIEVALSTAGLNHDWAHWTIEHRKIAAGESTRAVLTIEAPDDAQPGSIAEVYAIAEDAKDPLITALTKVRATVVNEPIPQGDAPDIIPAQNDAPAPAAYLLLVLALFAARRTRS